MTRGEFKDIARQAIETVMVVAEGELSRSLPRRYLLRWLGGRVDVPGDDIAELLTNAVFVSEDEIYPCVDLFLDELLPDGRLVVLCYRAGFEPCPYGAKQHYVGLGHDAGFIGPFKLSCCKLIEKLSAA